jgi:hypothetical protein
MKLFLLALFASANAASDFTYDSTADTAAVGFSKAITDGYLKPNPDAKFASASQAQACPQVQCAAPPSGDACIRKVSFEMKANGCLKYPCGYPVCPVQTCPKDCNSWYNGCDTCTCTNGVASGCTACTNVMYGRPRCLDGPCARDGSSYCASPTSWDTDECKCVSDCTGNGDVPDECDDKEADIVFVLDSSGSISSTGWTSLLDAVGKIVTGLDISNTRMQVAARAFSGSTSSFPGFDLNEFYGWQNVKSEINSFPWMGSGTLLGAAVQNTNQNVLVTSAGRRQNVPAAMIIVTDGQTGDAALATAQAQAAQAAGVKVFTIGVKNYNSAQLASMASPDQTNTDGSTTTFQYGPIAGFDVDQFKTQLLQAICTEAAPTVPAPSLARSVSDAIVVNALDLTRSSGANWETCTCPSGKQYECRQSGHNSCCRSATMGTSKICNPGGANFAQLAMGSSADTIALNDPSHEDAPTKEDGGPNGWHTCVCADGSKYECKSKFGDGKQCCTRSMPAICGNDDGKVKSIVAGGGAVAPATPCPDPGPSCRDVSAHATANICGPGRVCTVMPGNPPEECPYAACVSGAPDHHYVNR